MNTEDYFTEAHAIVALEIRLKLFVHAIKSLDENLAAEDLRKFIMYHSNDTEFMAKTGYLMDSFVHIFNKRLKE